MIGLSVALVLRAAAVAAGEAPDPRAIEALALNAALLSRPSATETLSLWCADHHWAADPRIVATRDDRAPRPPSAETLRLLGAPPEQLSYRAVALSCGGRILSRAENWYRPDRLTPAMNDALATTRTPFGAVVKPLGFTRRTLSALVSPERPGRPTPPVVVRHRAVLTTRAGLAFSVVEESYTAEALGAP